MIWKNGDGVKRLEQVIRKLQDIYPGFEVREAQRRMMETMYKAMIGQEKCAIHAPTGVGKSLGYLIPYVAVKLQRPNFKMTVSTYTIHLQEQLKKEIALMQKLYALLQPSSSEQRTLSVVTWKGKANYYCEARADQVAPFVTEAKEKAQFTRLWERMGELRAAGEKLDRQHVGFPIADRVWQRVNVEHCDKQDCQLRRGCTYYQHYVSDKWDLLILNHALYFTYQLYVEPWEADFSVFDEAHHLPKVLIEAATYSLSYDRIVRWVQQGGRLARMHGYDGREAEEWEQRFLTHEAVLRFKRGEGSIQARMREQTLIFKSSGFREAVGNLSEWQKNMYHSLTKDTLPESREDLEKDDGRKKNGTYEDDETERLAKEKDSWVLQLLELKEFQGLLNHPAGLLWAEQTGQQTLLFHVSPQSMSYFTEPLFVEGASFTSGTLGQDGSCQAFAEALRVPLDRDEVLPTPYPLAERTRVYVSSRVHPKAPTYREDLAAEIMGLLRAGELKTFVLFSSIQLMHDQYERLRRDIEALPSELPIRVWLQDRYNKEEVIASFANREEKSVLFGSLSFFEGVDLRGDSLTQVILTRLPYAYFRHPIQRILNRNGNYSEWEAVLRFEQAYGRLMRRMDDYGTFAILDQRYRRHPAFGRLFAAEGVKIVSSTAEIAAFYEEIARARARQKRAADS